MKLVIHPDELLREKSEKITDINGEIIELAQDMITTMREARGIGLAGVQVGVLQRLFVTHVSRDKARVFINPTIIETSVDQVDYEEGCLSIPAIYADVTRPESVRVQAWNERGRPFTMTIDGLLARVVQHELDHLDGVLFLDYLSADTRARVMSSYDPHTDPVTASRDQ
jgi:peptide deformylase